MNRKTLTDAVVGAALVTAGLSFTSSFGAGETSVANLAEKTHVHGIAVDRDDPSRLMLATHHGFHVASGNLSNAANGHVRQVTPAFPKLR